ncbi:MAG TPA: nucleotide kinase domain-containing protein [Candidatus Angelobacter sp.]|nr:nucleotide kinase domain-containing protein [Candidatus Angelobacter sp.]
MLIGFSKSAKPKPTPVFRSYWYFAAERQHVFFRRLAGNPPPWTDDQIINAHRFTNAYRVLDRVSQFLIREVIYYGSQKVDEIFFRTLLFKIFNRIETWQRLLNTLGEISWATYDFTQYDKILSEAMTKGIRIFSPAYIMPSGSRQFGESRKHRNYLRLLERMMKECVPEQLLSSSSMLQAYSILRSYPLLGDFLAYQYLTDINYSETLPFSEMEFVTPGPGAKSGIEKCFSTLGDLSHADTIRWVTENQEESFRVFGFDFRNLFGRALQLIDCQNLFCEVDKYARVKHPEFNEQQGRFRIKRKFYPNGSPIHYWFPPKWKLTTTLPENTYQLELVGCI